MRFPAPEDGHLWEHVRARVTPLGAVAPPPRSFVRRRRPRYDVDLHGDTVQAAYERVGAAVARARGAGRGEIVVVTGLSGQIRREFLVWAALNREVAAFEPINGGGAYRVRLQRPHLAP